jgi:tRNA dimethylallyltransferase
VRAPDPAPRVDSQAPPDARAARILVIAGPTSAGKSALAMRLAERLPVEIVSCDSQQVYRGLDIGTGKPSAEERARVPHHLLDVVLPTETFHAAKWADAARATLKQIAARGRLPLVVGGTGLYLRALLSGLFDAPPPSREIRERHRREAESAGVESLHARLQTIDPEVAARVMPRDLVRISRALEVFEQTGERLSELQNRARAQGTVDLAARVWVLEPPMSELRGRIHRRFDAMMAAGLLEETRRLRDQFGAEARGLCAIGYRELGAHLEGRTTLVEAVAAAKGATVAYARRQRTWFRKQDGARTSADPPTPEALLGWWHEENTRGGGPPDSLAARAATQSAAP